MARTRTDGNLTIGTGRPSVSFLQKVLAMVDWHIKLSKKDDVLLLEGAKPHTNLYAVDCDISKGYPVLTLTTLT